MILELTIYDYTLIDFTYITIINIYYQKCLIKASFNEAFSYLILT